MNNDFEKEFDNLIELSNKVLVGLIEPEAFMQFRQVFFEKYNK